MAVGETSGQNQPRQVVSSASRRTESTEGDDATPAEPAEGTETAEPEPLVKEADPELERLIAEEEAIEKSLRDNAHSETPHFRPGDAD